jgi:hypothetical protein
MQWGSTRCAREVQYEGYNQAVYRLSPGCVTLAIIRFTFELLSSEERLSL